MNYILTTLIAAAALSASPAQAEGPFRKLGFDAALKEAEKDGKLLFIDFYTTWCGPCKMMEATTFKDAWVVKWLTEKAVSLEVDAEKDEKLADKFEVEFYPTLVFLNSKGEVLERINGYVTADEFREAAKDLHMGVTAMDRTKQELEKNPDNPKLRLDLASGLVRKNDFGGALRELLWCLDHGTEKDPSFAELRDTRLLDELFTLATMYEPAGEELMRRRDVVERRLLDNKPNPGDPAFYAGFCMVTMDSDRLLATYDAVASRGAQSPTAQTLFTYAFPALLEAHRYKDIAGGVDINARLEEIFSDGSKALADLAKENPNAGDEQRDMIKAQTVARAAEFFQILLALDRTDDARKLAKRVLAFDDSPDSQHALAWEGYLSQKPIPECLDYAKFALSHAAEEEKANVTDTVARLMFALGKTDEAISLCEDNLNKVESDRDKWILTNCVDDLRGKTAHSG